MMLDFSFWSGSSQSWLRGGFVFQSLKLSLKSKTQHMKAGEVLWAAAITQLLEGQFRTGLLVQFPAPRQHLLWK